MHGNTRFVSEINELTNEQPHLSYSCLSSLNPVHYKEGILRVGGRLSKWDQMFSILLLKNNQKGTP